MGAGGGRTRASGPDGELSFFFDGIESPNGTIFPDALLDHVMPFLSPTEWKVCSYIVRRTFGWKKASDRISLEQVCRGIVRRDGSRLDHGTQLDRKTTIKALRGLEAKGVIVAQRNYSAARGFEPTTYGLRFRGQAPTRTLGEKLPQGSDGLGEDFPQGLGDDLHEGPGEAFHQASGSAPPALVEARHPQRTPGPTNNSTSGWTDRDEDDGAATESDRTGETGARTAAEGGKTSATRPGAAVRKERGAAGPSPVDDGATGADRAALSDAGATDAARPRRQDGETVGADHPSAATAGAPGAARRVPAAGSTPGARGKRGRAAAGGAPGAARAPTSAGTDTAALAALWTTTLARLQAQMTTTNYQTWLADTAPLGREGSLLLVAAPSECVRDWLQTRLRLIVRRALQDVDPTLDDVRFAVNGR